MSSLSLKRAQKEFARLQSDGIPGVAVTLVNDADPFRWSAKFEGPAGSPYAGGKFDLRITLNTEEYPNVPPALAFHTKVYHPGVNKDDGKLCEGLLADWVPTSCVKDVLVLVISTLADCMKAPHGVLNDDAAKELNETPDKFRATAANWTKLYAK